MKKPITTVIFDMNGVLIGDEPAHEQAFRDVARDMGMDVDHETYMQHAMGRTDFEGWQNLLQAWGKTELSVEELTKKKMTKYFALVHDNGLPSYPGAAELVRELGKTFELALVTNAPKEEARLILKTFGIIEEFKIIATSEDIYRGKPDPEPYLLAAKKLGRHASTCVVIEDSAVGVAAAKAAGMHCIAVAQTTSKDNLAQADCILPTIKDITKNHIVQLTQ